MIFSRSLCTKAGGRCRYHIHIMMKERKKKKIIKSDVTGYFLYTLNKDFSSITNLINVCSTGNLNMEVRGEKARRKDRTSKHKAKAKNSSVQTESDTPSSQQVTLKPQHKTSPLITFTHGDTGKKCHCSVLQDHLIRYEHHHHHPEGYHTAQKVLIFFKQKL